MKNSKLIVLVIVLLIIIGGGSFYAGIKYQKSQRPQFGQTSGPIDSQGRRAGFGQNGNNRPVSGEIISSDDKSITVKLTDGSSKIALVSGSTQINKTDPAAKSDLTVGQKVLVVGSANSDGSVTAQNIQLHP